jgi:ribosomal protein L7/L12
VLCQTDTVTDQQQSQELTEHGHRIAQLELKVAELYKRLGQQEPALGEDSRSGEQDPGTVAAEHPRVIELLQADRKLEAVKLYRELTGSGLAEANDAVERLAAVHQPTS